MSEKKTVPGDPGGFDGAAVSGGDKMKGLALTKADRAKLMAQGIILRDDSKPAPKPKPKSKRKRRATSGRPNAYTPEEIVEIVRMAKAGKNPRQIGEFFQKNSFTAYGYLLRRGRYMWLDFDEIEWLKERRSETEESR